MLPVKAGTAKGEAKPYTLKINGEEKTVKPVNAEVVNGFYSPLEKSVGESKSEKWGSGEQALAELKSKGGLKSDELKWTGLEEWLKQQGKVTKSDILDYLKNNRVQLVEVVKGGENLMNASNKEEALAALDAGYTLTDSEGLAIIREKIERGYANINYPLEVNDFKSDTKFSQYQLEGQKENYKEIMIVLPREVKRLSLIS